MDQPLSGRVAVVTGAGRGIGRAIALAYGAAGAAVVCAARTEREIEDTAGQITAQGGQALAVPADVTCDDAVTALFARTLAAWGGADIVVLSAGGNYDRAAVANSDPDGWKQTLEVNLLGAYRCARAAIPCLKSRGGGKIITLGSGLGHHGMAGGSAYACSKAGLWMLTRVLAQELWPDHISVNELIPGPVHTFIDRDTSTPSRVEGIAGEWIKQPEDVVPLALFLATQPEPGPTAQSFSLMRRDG